MHYRHGAIKKCACMMPCDELLLEGIALDV